MKRLILILATFLGVGYIRYAPGSFGALGGWVLYEALNPGRFALLLSVLFVAFAVLVVSVALGFYPPSSGKDPSSVVLDEAAAMWLVLSLLPVQTFAAKALGFAFFRFFDVVKPFGIKYVEKIPHYALAIVLDDVVAALYAAASVNIIFYIWSRFF